MKKILTLLLVLSFATLAAPVYAQDFDSEEACAAAGNGKGFCMDTTGSVFTLDIEESVISRPIGLYADDDNCQRNQDTLGICVGYINNSACCAFKDNGPVDPDAEEEDSTDANSQLIIGTVKCESTKAQGGWGGVCKSPNLSLDGVWDACDDSGNNEEDYVGLCDLTAQWDPWEEQCCVPKGTGIQNPTSSNFDSRLLSESLCEAPVSEGGLGGKCEAYANENLGDTIGNILNSQTTCDTTNEVVAAICEDGGLALGSSDTENGCCVPKNGEYCASLEAVGGSCEGAGTGIADTLSYGDYTLLERIPGADSDSGDLSTYLQNIYQAGLILVVLGAVFMIAVGGFTYMASAGNTSAIKKGKGMITDALIGLIIALFAWFILNVINPDLVNLKIDPLPAIQFEANVQLHEDSGTPLGTASTTGASIKCPSELVELPSKYSLKGGSTKICPELLAQLDKISSVSGWRVTRLTGGGAQSQCHKAGTDREGSCVDIAFNPNPGFNDSKWDSLCQAVKGLSSISVLNEASNSAGCKEALGAFTKTANQTGAHLHINFTGK